MKKYRLCFGDQVLALFNMKVLYVHISVDTEIDRAQLEDAVNKALYYHPTFKTKLVKYKGIYYLEENSQTAMVREFSWDDKYTFSNEDNNDYPWVIICSGKDLVFAGAHAVSDGGGINRFLQTVLQIYYELSGETFTGDFGKPQEDMIAESVCDPVERFAVPNAADPFPLKKKTERKKLLRIPDEMYVKDPSKVRVHQFIFDEQLMHRLSKSSETSTFAVISALLAKSMANCLNAETGFVKVGVACNLRSVTHANTDRNFAYTPDLNYDVALCKDKDIDFISTGFRSQLDMLLDYDSVIYRISEMHKRTLMVSKHPFILRLVGLFKEQFLHNNYAKIIYTHMTRPGFDEELMKHITLFQPLPSNQLEKRNLVIASNYNGQIRVALAHIMKDEIWEKEMEKVLKEYGIPYKMEVLRYAPSINYKGIK